MICSMTAFARYENKGNWGTAIWEIRSVNQRYLETYIHLPEQFRGLEPVIRERIRTRLTRGKVQCYLYFETNSSIQNKLVLNENLAKQLVIAAQWVKMQSNEGEIDPIAVLRWPGVMIAEEQDLDNTSVELLVSLDKAMNDFILSRETEGIALQSVIEQYLSSISAAVADIRQQLPNLIIWQREKILNRIEEAQIQLDTNRLEQELVMLAHRVDVTEELDRIEAHVREIFNVLTKKKAVGRHLEFIIQELNRESNTLASKSINARMTTSAIDLKVLIEQIREQIQNIE